ncbi:MAG: hypothetical protein K8R48_07030 [Alphaproteobacteria bacterium]|nr:hypothetical protein [Alphaproteobacteria bacterium]
MTLQEISSFVSDWGTFLAALAAFLTLLEMHRQRKHSYKPDIVPIEKTFNGYFESAIFCTWKENIPQKLAKRDKTTSADVDIKLSLFNLGNGAAKNLQFEWDFEFESFIKKLNSINKKAETGIEIDNSGPLLQFKENGQCKIGVNLKPNLKDRKDYLLPASIEREGLKISLPMAYIWLVSNYFYLRFKILSKDLPFGIPDLRLNIEYSDIAGNKYQTVFLFNIGLIFFAHGEPMPDFRAYIHYKLSK